MGEKGNIIYEDFYTMPVIEINGKKIEAESGSMIIEVADNIGIQIPRFCYHKKLSIAANCRMCLVDVEKSPKPLPACATPITEGMKIWTQSPKALLAQKAVMEFLLINHPLDCPICDQGGECELQDLSMGFGKDVSRYTEKKRVVQDKDIGPLIETDMTRCIQCTRCVRFGTEIAGVRELGATGRGEAMEIGTYIEKNVTSELSGNVIDLCPVGALTSKPYRFTARGWELTQKPSIAPHDGVGSNLFLHIRRNQVMRVVPRENEAINEVWLSDRDRFSYQALNSPERLHQPKIKRSGQWYTISWSEVLTHVSETLLELTRTFGSDAIGALISPNSTLEECYLIQKLMRSLGSHNIDHRLRQGDFRNQEGVPLYPSLGINIQQIENQSTILLVGSDIRKEQPILGLKLRKATLLGGSVCVINPIDFAFNFDISEKVIVPQGDLVLGLARVAKALLTEKAGKSTTGKIPSGAAQWLADVVPEEKDIRIARRLMSGENNLILLGALALSHPALSQLIALANLIAEFSGAQFGLLSEGANSTGAWLTGCVPHRLPGGKSAGQEEGLTATQMWEQALKAYVLLNIEPELDCLDGMKALLAMKQAKQVIAITPFESKSLLEYADILLPMTPFTETSGTFVNMEGKWQSFHAATTPLGESRPAWKILRVLGTLCASPGFDYDNSEQVKEAFCNEIEQESLQDPITWDWWCSNTLECSERSDIIRIAPVPLYASDGLVRRASSLQKTQDAGKAAIYLNQNLADALHLTGDWAQIILEHENHLTLPLVIDETVADKSVVIQSGIPETISCGAPYARIKIRAIEDKDV